jgi:hypothetical protein
MVACGGKEMKGRRFTYIFAEAVHAVRVDLRRLLRLELSGLRRWWCSPRGVGVGVRSGGSSSALGSCSPSAESSSSCSLRPGSVTEVPSSRIC